MNAEKFYNDLESFNHNIDEKLGNTFMVTWKKLEKCIKRMQDNHEWFFRSGVNVSIIELAEMFGEWKLVPERRGERKVSEYFETDTESRLGWRPKHELKNWIGKVKQNISNGTE